MITAFAERMKRYEVMGEAVLMPLLPIVVRLDGKSFHTWTKGLSRPYDARLCGLMRDATIFLVEQTNARIGYCQSDEISLVLMADEYDDEVFMGGRSSKLISVITSMLTGFFNSEVSTRITDRSNKLAFFDCRVWNVPNKIEAANALLWREQDATRNAIQMVGQAYFNHNQLMNKSCAEIQEMLWSEKSLNFNDYPPFFKRGQFVQRRELNTPFTAEEIASLPSLHNAKKNPDLIVTRHDVRTIDMPIMSKVINRVEVIFDGDEPVLSKED